MRPPAWAGMHAAPLVEDQIERLRQCTYGGRPFGGEDFVARMEEQFGRSWRPVNRKTVTQSA